MSFSISEFHAQIAKRGIAKTNRFVCRITTLPTGIFDSDWIPPRELQYFCKSVSLPPLSIATEAHSPHVIGRQEARPTGFEKAALPTIFYMDQSHDVLKIFQRWAQLVYNYDTSSPYATISGNQSSGEIGYKENYEGTIEVLYYGSDGQLKNPYVYRFEGVFPNEIGAIDLSWENNDQVATLPVSFSYSRMFTPGIQLGNLEISNDL